MREPVTTTVSTFPPPCCAPAGAVMPMAAAEAAPRSRAERRLRLFWLVLNTWNPLGSVGNDDCHQRTCLPEDDSCPRASARIARLIPKLEEPTAPGQKPIRI